MVEPRMNLLAVDTCSDLDCVDLEFVRRDFCVVDIYLSNRKALVIFTLILVRILKRYAEVVNHKNG